MRIVCPNCSTTYRIADAAIGSSGRGVRCARCQTVWHVGPEPAMSAEAAAASEETAFGAELGASLQADAAPAEPSVPEPTA
ncbi:MAG: zinc-ribbon domain-containing protein, partial [Bradyrhizobium guangdongense]